MISNSFVTRARINLGLSSLSDRSLSKIELSLTNRIADIHRFCPWPALEESLAQDIAKVWREQKARAINKGKEK